MSMPYSMNLNAEANRFGDGHYARRIYGNYPSAKAQSGMSLRHTSKFIKSTPEIPSVLHSNLYAQTHQEPSALIPRSSEVIDGE